MTLPFRKDGGTLGKSNLVLLENGSIIRDDVAIAETFNDYYVNSVELTARHTVSSVP